MRRAPVIAFGLLSLELLALVVMRAYRWHRWLSYGEPLP